MYNFCFLFNNYFNQKKKEDIQQYCGPKFTSICQHFHRKRLITAILTMLTKGFNHLLEKKCISMDQIRRKAKTTCFIVKGCMRCCFKIAVPLEHAQWRAVLSRHSGSLRLMSIFLLNISSSRVSQSPIEAASCSSNPDVILHLTQVINRVTL